MSAQAFGVGMSTVGALFGAVMQKDMLKHQARMADINAGIFDSNARNITQAGTVEESRVKLAGSQAKAQQRAQITASGVDIAGSPTALARLTGTDLITEVDARTVRSNTLRAAWGQRFAAGDMRRRGVSARATAAGISPLAVGATALLDGATTVASSWYALSKEGAFGSKPDYKKGTISFEDADTSAMIVDPVPFTSELAGDPRYGSKRNPYTGY